jgi:hypothetical protein
MPETASQRLEEIFSDALDIEKSVGPYKLLQKIGEGGCGVVYMAEQESRSAAGLRSRSSSSGWTPRASSRGSRRSGRRSR